MTFDYVALNKMGDEVSGTTVASDISGAMSILNLQQLFPTKILEHKPIKFNMNLAQALKLKNRLAGELVKQQQILQRENARRSDSVSKVDRERTWNNIRELSARLGELKGKITQANIGIYPSLERMAELKSRIAYLNSLPKREGEEVTFVGRDQEEKKYHWNSFINQESCDAMVAELQEKINELQDKVDEYNATTQIAE